MTKSDRPSGGFHGIVEEETPFLFVDATMQIWPDAELEKAHRHGVTAYAVTACRPHDGLENVVEDLVDWRRVVREHSNLLVAETVEDVRRAKREGRAALILAAQGGDWIGRRLHRVEAGSRLGLRQLLLAYNATNGLADGCLDRTDGGLSKLGARVVEECNRVGILLDATHTGRRATLELIETSAHPVIFSHSNPSALSPNPRNIDDEQIRACAARRGVVCLAPWGPLVLRPGSSQQPTVDDFIDMIDHVAELTGTTDSIGIGTDMSLGSYPIRETDPWGAPDYGDPFADYGEKVTADPRSPRRNLDGFSDYSEVVSFAIRLRERGFAENDVRNILGESYLRVASQVWPAAER